MMPWTEPPEDEDVEDLTIEQRMTRAERRIAWLRYSNRFLLGLVYTGAGVVVLAVITAILSLVIVGRIKP